MNQEFHKLQKDSSKHETKKKESVLAPQRGSHLKVLKRPSLMSQDQLLVEKHKSTSSKSKPEMLYFLQPRSEIKVLFQQAPSLGCCRVEQLLSAKLNMNKQKVHFAGLGNSVPAAAIIQSSHMAHGISRHPDISMKSAM